MHSIIFLVKNKSVYIFDLVIKLNFVTNFYSAKILTIAIFY